MDSKKVVVKQIIYKPIDLPPTDKSNFIPIKQYDVSIYKKT